MDIQVVLKFRDGIKMTTLDAFKELKQAIDELKTAIVDALPKWLKRIIK